MPQPSIPTWRPRLPSRSNEASLVVHSGNCLHTTNPRCWSRLPLKRVTCLLGWSGALPLMVRFANGYAGLEALFRALGVRTVEVMCPRGG